MTTTPKFLNSIPWHLVATRFLPNHQSTKENSYSWSIFHQKRNGNLNTAKLFHESLARLKHLFIHFSKNLTWRSQEIQHETHNYTSSFFSLWFSYKLNKTKKYRRIRPTQGKQDDLSIHIKIHHICPICFRKNTKSNSKLWFNLWFVPKSQILNKP